MGAVRPLPQLSVQQVVPGFLIRFFIRTTLALCCSGISHSATPMSPSSQMLTPRTTQSRAIEETLSIASCSTKPGNRKRQELQILNTPGIWGRSVCQRVMEPACCKVAAGSAASAPCLTIGDGGRPVQHRIGSQPCQSRSLS